MLVLGIDPGSQRTGYGLVDRERGRYVLRAAGVVKTDTEDPIPERLNAIYEGLSAVIAAHKPEVVAIEAIFRHKSSESALRLGQARGVALLAAARAGLQVFEYNASTVKKSVTGSGKADKDMVGRMVGMLLGANIPLSADAADAVAIAMTHLAHAHQHRSLESAR